MKPHPLYDTPGCATHSDENVSIIIPAKNEERTIGDLLHAMGTHFPKAEHLLVLNGTTDNTEKAAQDAAGLAGVTLRCITLKSPGKGLAMRAGAECATRRWLLFHDADLEYSVPDAAQLTAFGMSLGDATVTIGARVMPLGQMRLSSYFANAATRALMLAKIGRHRDTRHLLPYDLLSGTRLISSAAFKSLSLDDNGFTIETSIAREALAAGLTLASYPVGYLPRTIQEGRHIRPWHLLPIVRSALRTPLTAKQPQPTRQSGQLSTFPASDPQYHGSQ